MTKTQTILEQIDWDRFAAVEGLAGPNKTSVLDRVTELVEATGTAVSVDHELDTWAASDQTVEVLIQRMLQLLVGSQTFESDTDPSDPSGWIAESGMVRLGALWIAMARTHGASEAKQLVESYDWLASPYASIHTPDIQEFMVESLNGVGVIIERAYVELLASDPPYASALAVQCGNILRNYYALLEAKAQGDSQEQENDLKVSIMALGSYLAFMATEPM